jgi:hypothetical protein
MNQVKIYLNNLNVRLENTLGTGAVEIKSGYGTYP